MSDYVFIPIVYPNKVPNTEVPPPLPASFTTVNTTTVPGTGYPFIASAPYVAPEPLPEPKPLQQTGVLIDPTATLTYHPLSALPATTTVNAGIPTSTPPLITHFSGSEPLYAPYTESGGNATKLWSLYSAVSTVDLSGFDMKNLSTLSFIKNSAIRDVDEISLSDNGFGSLTLNSLGIQSARSITGVTDIALNNQVLTAQPTALLLNGVPIATISDLPNIYEWANYPSISSILMEDGNGVQNSAFYEFDTSKQLLSIENPTPVGTTRLVYDGNIICSTDFTGAYKATGVSTGVPQWATFLAIQDTNYNQKQITNINKITFNTAIPGLGNAAISAVNTIGFALTAGAATTAAIRDCNRIEFWNPLFPGIPGAQINLGTNAQGKMFTDVQFQCPNLLLDSAVVDVGPVAGANANWMVINNRPCPGFWSRFPATQALNIANNNINQVNSIQLAFANAGPFCVLGTNAIGELLVNGQVFRNVASWSQYPPVQDVNWANFSINNMNTINFGATNSLNAVGNILQWRGQPVATGAITPATWANFPAVNNVSIPAAYSLSINAENTLDDYLDSQLNTNIIHGVEGNVFFSPDFTSYPRYFSVGSFLTFRAREVSLNSGLEGTGLNANTEINIDAALGVFINSTAIMEITAGGAVTLTSGLTMLLDSTGEMSLTAPVITINGAAAVEIGGTTLTATVLGLTTLVTSGLDITAGATTVETGVIGWATGVSTWASPAWTLVSAATTINGAQMTINSGNLNVTSATTTIASGTTAITSAVINIPTGKVFVNEVDAYTTDSLVINGAKTINGAVATGLAMTDVKSIAGQGSGVNITNIANFETYSATNVLLPCESFYAGIANISLNAGSSTLVYTSPSLVWNWTNIPFLSYAISVTGYTTITSVGSVFNAADPAYMSGYVVLKNITKPGRTVVLATPDPVTTGEYIEYATTSTPNYTKGKSMFNITYNFQYIQDAYNFAVGDSYQIQVFMTNQLAPTLTPVLNLTGAKIQFNVHNANALP